MTTKLLLDARYDSLGHAARMARWLLPFALGCVLTGCLSRPALVRQTFALQAASLANSAAPAGQAVLEVRALEVSPRFEGLDFIYRRGADLYQADPYAGFLISPSRELAIALRSGFRSSGAFKDVVEPKSQLGADTALEVYITELYGDFRKPDQLAAVLSMRLLFFETGNGKARQPFLEKEYTCRVPLPQKTAAALVAGWNQALGKTVADVVADLAATEATRPA
ncbi:MAG: ABC-type transport auxiliary lipoprotein family protein, partial [Planctomycetota bacterium]|nr:ABC-type transport auxiliary lipoprotein family protein [Planctomycetota bacterium]